MSRSRPQFPRSTLRPPFGEEICCIFWLVLSVYGSASNKRLSNHGTSDGSGNRPRSIYQYSNMAPRPSGVFRSFRNWKTKETLKIWPESLGAMLEYWYIEHGLLRPQSRVFADLTGKPWITAKVSIFNRLANWLWLKNSMSTVTFAPQNWWIADLLLLRTSLEAPVWPKLDFRSKQRKN